MTSWAVGTAVAVSLLIILVLVARRPVARLFGARAAYALWLAPALRAVMPPLPQFAALPSPAAAADAQYWLVASAATPGGGPAASAVLAMLWLGGALARLGVHIWRHHRFLGNALATGRAWPLDAVRYDVVATPAVDGPAATGLLHPLILVPLDFETRFTPEQQRFALWHEQLHHRRGDIWASAAALIVTALLWFNPLAHLALRAFRRDMEAACDERLLADAGRAAAPAYAQTILRCAARSVPRSLCALTSIDELKGRLMMLNLNHGRGRRLLGLVLAGGVALAGLGLALPAAAGEAPEKKVFTKKIVVHESSGDRDVVKRAEAGDIERLGAKCDGEKVELSADGGSADKKEAVKFVICARKGEGRAELAGALEKAAADLGKENEMDPAIKAELLAKLRAKIDSLRAGG